MCASRANDASSTRISITPSLGTQTPARIGSRSKAESARFLAEILGLPAPRSFGPFAVVDLAGDASLDFIDAGDYEFQTQHYAFLVGEAEFDTVFGRIRERGL